MMEHFLTLLGSFQPGSLPTWGTFGIAIAWFTRQHFANRRLRLAENKDDREGYGALIATLNASIVSMEAKHTADIADLRREHVAQIDRMTGEHRRCEERLSKIEGELLGFHRQALVRSQLEATLLPASGKALAAGERAIAAATDKLTTQPIP